MSQVPHIVDDLPNPVVLVDPKTRLLIWANHSAQEWLGRSLKSLRDKSLNAAFSDDDKVLEHACDTVLESLAPVHIHEFSTPFRGRAVKRITAVTVFKSGENLACQFIPHSRAPSAHVKGSLTLTAMGRMLAHEIKNPLAGINGAAQLIRDDVTTSESHALVDLIEAETSRIRRLADRMERLGDQDPEISEDVNIHEVIRHARRIMEPAISQTIMFSEHFDPSLPLLKGDSDTLIQAVLNLIKNAAEAIEESGKGDVILLETAYESGVTRRIGDEEAAQHLPVVMRVRDNGPGINDEIRERLFQPFISSKPTGQGLGLALVSKVAMAHGGLVDAQNRNGWTEFSLRLPAPDIN